MGLSNSRELTSRAAESKPWTAIMLLARGLLALITNVPLVLVALVAVLRVQSVPAGAPGIYGWLADGPLERNFGARVFAILGRGCLPAWGVDALARRAQAFQTDLPGVLNRLRCSGPHVFSARCRADADRDHGLVSAIRWLLHMVPAPSMDWVPRPRLFSHLRHAPVTVGASATPSPHASGRPLNILSMDGGGMRGLNLLVLAEEIEIQTGKPLASLFDLVAGTSIGGCGALFINKYPAPGEATRMARLALSELQHKCFALEARSRSSLFWKGHLCLDRRREFILEICGQAQPIRLPKGKLLACP
jgi:hypothetical protein